MAAQGQMTGEPGPRGAAGVYSIKTLCTMM